MRLSQITDENGKRALVTTARGESRLVKGARTTLQLAEAAIAAGTTLKKLVAERGVGKPVDLAACSPRWACTWAWKSPAGRRKTSRNSRRGFEEHY